MNTCSTESCDRPVKYRGLCGACYARERRNANLERCREQEKARAQRQRDTRREILNERKRAEYEADPDKFKRRVADYRAANPEKVRERELEKGRRFMQDHRELHRERSREANKRFRVKPEFSLKNREYLRARKARMGGGTVDYAAILEEFGMVCHLCGGDIASREDLHFDHVIPLARGGEHHADNIRPSHAFCNTSKGARV